MLPKIDLPVYDLKIPSSGKKIKVRPFTVKEEKLLLMAMESEEDDIDRTTLQVVNNCILTKGVDIEKLPFFDIDYIFIFLRAKSVGESIEVKFTCNNTTEAGLCSHEFPAKVDIMNYKLLKDDEISTDIKLGPNSMVKMRYPTYSGMKKIMERDVTEIEEKVDMIADCIDMVVQGDEVHSRKDYTKEELTEFVESLPASSFRKLEQFIENFPTFVVKVETKCPKCGFDHEIEYTEYESFFV